MDIYKMFDIPILGKMIRRVIVKKEGGDKISKNLRKYCEKKRKVSIGMHTYGSCFADGFNTGGEVTIGRYCSFGPSIRYFGANHPIKNAIMSPYFYNKAWGGFEVKDINRSYLQIGNDVWIGANVIITSGCKKIGNGAVIGAGSVVTKDVDPYEIVVGNPAHRIKTRFNEEIIELLERSQWWLFEPTELYKYYNLMDSPGEFAQEIILLEKKKNEI